MTSVTGAYWYKSPTANGRIRLTIARAGDRAFTKKLSFYIKNGDARETLAQRAKCTWECQGSDYEARIPDGNQYCVAFFFQGDPADHYYVQELEPNETPECPLKLNESCVLDYTKAELRVCNEDVDFRPKAGSRAR